jgi:hypothetical protein
VADNRGVSDVVKLCNMYAVGDKIAVRIGGFEHIKVNANLRDVVQGEKKSIKYHPRKVRWEVRCGAAGAGGRGQVQW